jgi:oligopeptidase A
MHSTPLAAAQNPPSNPAVKLSQDDISRSLQQQCQALSIARVACLAEASDRSASAVRTLYQAWMNLKSLTRAAQHQQRAYYFEAGSAEHAVQWTVAVQQAEAMQHGLWQDAALLSCLKSARQALTLDADIQQWITSALSLQSAAALPMARRQAALAQQVTLLQAQYAANLQDDMASWQWHIEADHAHLLAGIPAAYLQVLQAQAHAAGLSGHLLRINTLRGLRIAQYAAHALLRRTLFMAEQSLASERSNAGFDNGPICSAILALRLRQAELAGFDSAQAHALDGQQINSATALQDWLDELSVRLRPAIARDIAYLQQFANTHTLLGTADTPMTAADLPYVKRCSVNALRVGHAANAPDRFALLGVVAGLANLCHALFGISWQSEQDLANKDPSVISYCLLDHDNRAIGRLTLDLLARAHKQPGAWSDLLQHASPAAVLCCDFMAENLREARLEHADIVTLLHEFGHCLQLLLSAGAHALPLQDAAHLQDAIEYPSSWMEQCASSAFGLSHLLGAPEFLPHAAESAAWITARQQHCASLQIGRQLLLASYDFALHSQRRSLSVPELEALYRAAHAELGLLYAPALQRGAQSFWHIFSGGYGGRYYTYLLAHVQSAAAHAALGLQQARALSRQEQQAALASFLQPPQSYSTAAFFSGFGL